MRKLPKDWTLGRDDDAPPGYRWVLEHPDHGEFYFRTKREALTKLAEVTKVNHD